MAKEKPARAASVASPSTESYTVVARRYRPQQFEDLVGQEPVARALMNAIEGDRVAHAYLFTGARGVGKTSTARILAKALNCVKGPTAHPCDKCDSCLSIATGEDVDVLEIDGASNTGVDNIRELRSSAQYRPTRARFRIFIIDEVHMISRNAFNALLKTLEEPPPHVKFIFATTEAQKIPLTILSRCQRFDFAGIGQASIAQRLKQIVQQEGMKAEDEALEMIARRSGGSMRDAQSLLDQLLAFSGERLTGEQVHGLLGTAQEELVVGLVDAVLAGDMARALGELGKVADQGVQLGELLDQVIAYWRDLMVVRAAGKAAPDLSVGPRHQATLGKHAESLSLEAILAGLDILSTARARLRQTSYARTLFEMALIRLGRLNDLVSIGELAASLANGQPVAPRSPQRAVHEISGSARSPEEPAVKKKSSAELAATEPTAGNGDTHQVRFALSQEALPQILEHALAGLGSMFSHHVRLAALAISGPNDLVLRFPADYTQEKEYCLEPERFRRLEESFRKVLQTPCRVRIETAAEMGETGGPGNVARPSADSGPQVQRVSPAPDQPSAMDRRRHREEVQKIPLVKAALDMLDAQIVKLDDDFGQQVDNGAGAVAASVTTSSSMDETSDEET
jgi:DNA polymerase-3 subunit gamma/tau